ncbi:MAG TPA: lysylphosphatidylglycerol synthase transmembrane domain-containing protein [Candidatus Limnocylindrales bacterium]|nr:lysylphosphatidylglycerol synthase transmembrane domain-containing protein [Candidatus Limnocylindrales bacterium]
MSKKKIIYTLVLVGLAALIYLQIRTWRKFDWQSFKEQTEGVNVVLIAAGVAIIYFDYYLRAVRWKLLLKPMCKTESSKLLAPTMIGFTSMALLGRPGEFIRPFLIARKENLTMSSQLAVWVVERLFDMGAFALIFAINLLFSSDQLQNLPGFMYGPAKRVGHYNVSSYVFVELFGLFLLVGVLVGAFFAFRIRRNPDRAAGFIRRVFSPISEKFAHGLSTRVHTFGEGLNTVESFADFVQLFGLSVLLWLTIGGAYWCVTHAYADIGPDMTLSSCFLLTGGSVAGGVLQLPVVGGGSQLATIGILVGVFDYPKELAISAGMMLWLVTFMSIIPTGLVLTHFEHLSLRKLGEESKQEEEKVLEEQQ